MDSLPVAEFRTQIVQAVRDHPVVIVTAETGAGKSTQIPQYLLAEGWRLAVTQPRSLATRRGAERVAEEMGQPLGQLVGYRTADERCDSAQTRCLFCTDGLALVRQLIHTHSPDILVIDETHEWNLNIEVLVAWAKHQIVRESPFRLVLMSATLDTEALSEYFNAAPVIAIPGRSFPVRERKPGSSIEADAELLLREGHHVLVFQPGKAEIDGTIRQLKATPGLKANILPLHGDLTPEEQSQCFALPTRGLFIHPNLYILKKFKK